MYNCSASLIFWKPQFGKDMHVSFLVLGLLSSFAPYMFCFERPVGDRMENSMPTCCAPWMWWMCLRAPCLICRALSKLYSCWERWKHRPVLSSWLWGTISHTSPSDTPRWRAGWGLIQHSCDSWVIVKVATSGHPLSPGLPDGTGVLSGGMLGFRGQG